MNKQNDQMRQHLDKYVKANKSFGAGWGGEPPIKKVVTKKFKAKKYNTVKNQVFGLQGGQIK